MWSKLPPLTANSPCSDILVYHAYLRDFVPAEQIPHDKDQTVALNEYHYMNSIRMAYILDCVLLRLEHNHNGHECLIGRAATHRPLQRRLHALIHQAIPKPLVTYQGFMFDPLSSMQIAALNKDRGFTYNGPASDATTLFNCHIPRATNATAGKHFCDLFMQE